MMCFLYNVLEFSDQDLLRRRTKGEKMPETPESGKKLKWTAVNTGFMLAWGIPTVGIGAVGYYLYFKHRQSKETE